MAKADLTAERLRELLHYNPETGVFTRRLCPNKPYLIGEIAGGTNARGYRMIRVENGRYSAHRLAWLYIHGKWPKDLIDHVNGVVDDNRINNLREATNHENQQNRKTTAGRGPFSLGTRYREDLKKKWLARIRVNGHLKILGYFDTQEEAHQAYVVAKSKYHTFNPVISNQQ